MRRRGEDWIERKLKHDRPQPSDDLIDRVTGSVNRRRPTRRRWNLGLAFAMTLAIVTAFALTGGVSYASSAAYHSVKAVSAIAFTQHATGSSQKLGSKGDGGGQGGERSDGHSSGHNQYRPKILICHKPGRHQQTLLIPVSALFGHLGHGDYLGPCHPFKPPHHGHGHHKNGHGNGNGHNGKDDD